MFSVDTVRLAVTAPLQPQIVLTYRISFQSLDSVKAQNGSQTSQLESASHLIIFIHKLTPVGQQLQALYAGSDISSWNI